MVAAVSLNVVEFLSTLPNTELKMLGIPYISTTDLFRQQISYPIFVCTVWLSTVKLGCCFLLGDHQNKRKSACKNIPPPPRFSLINLMFVFNYLRIFLGSVEHLSEKQLAINYIN